MVKRSTANMKFSVIFASLCTILLMSSCATGISHSEYDHFAALDEFENFKLYWSVNDEQKEISFAVEVRTTGWVGFGISSGNGKMKGSDLVIGWVKDCKGHLTDRYADEYSVPVLDKRQDYELTGFNEKDGTTILKFKRKIDTCDQRDRKIMGGTTKVVYAYHMQDPKSPMDLQQHSAEHRGQRSLMLLNTFNGSSPHEDLKYFDVTNKKVSIPPADTVYWCHPVKLPTFDKKHHIVKVVPIINKGNEGLVHHIIVYMCNHNTFSEASLEQGQICINRNMPTDFHDCRRNSLLAAWAIGSKEFPYPSDAGYPVGTDDSPKIVLMEIHYDNPNKRSDLFDSSGLRFYYTTPRKYDAGVLMTGWRVRPEMVIPPGEDDWATSGYCPKQCTEMGFANTGIDGGGVNVFSVGLHTHLAGRKARVRHIRNGTELPELARDDHYDFNFQELMYLPKQVKVLPGDDIITECVYNTMDRTEQTTGGEKTLQEMCLSFVGYYPRTNLSKCWTRDLGYDSWLDSHGQSGSKTFPTKWNKTLAKELRAAYSNFPDVSARCTINEVDLRITVPKAEVLITLPTKDNCTASNVNRTHLLEKCPHPTGPMTTGHTSSGVAGGLGTSLLLACVLMTYSYI